MTREESQQRCRELFLREKAAGRVFYAVNRRYNALLRLPTAEELANGIETQETAHSRVKPSHVVVIRTDSNWSPVMVSTGDGRSIVDQWASGLDKVLENYDFEGELTSERCVQSRRNPGRPCAYIYLRESMETVHGRGTEIWRAGSFISCWDEVNLDQFTGISAQSFAGMKEPADADSARLLEQLRKS